MELQENFMLLDSPAVNVETGVFNGDKCLYFTFKGAFTKEASKNATEVWIHEFDRNPMGRYTVIWDCMSMSDFDMGAKNYWMETLAAYSRRIDTVIIVSDSILIRGAARLMAKFSQLNIELCKSPKELEKTQGELVG